MRRVALAGGCAALLAAGVVVAWPARSSVEARPFPPAASELRRLWSSAPASSRRFSPMLRAFHGWTQGDTRLVFDARLPYGQRLQLYVARDARGQVCFVESIGGGSCFASFEGQPANLGTTWTGEWNLMAGVLRDGTTAVDVELGGRWRPAHVDGRGVYLTAGGAYLGNAIQRVRYHLAGGTTRTCVWERPC